MKKYRTIKSLCVLIACILFVGILSSITIQAKAKRGKLKVKYNGKTIVMITTKTNKKNSEIIGMTTYKEIKKAWKNPTKTKKKYGQKMKYYKKGKTSIGFYTDAKWYDSNNQIDKSLTLAGFDIDIKDKNASLCGVKVGMSKKKALSVLRKQFDKKAIESTDDAITLWFGGFMPTSFSLENGKVVSMRFWCS